MFLKTKGFKKVFQNELFQTHFLWPLLYVSNVKISQTLLTPEGAQILFLFFIARLSVKKVLKKFDGKPAFRAFYQIRATYWEKLRLL